MEKTQQFEIIINSFKSYLEFVKEKYSKNIEFIKLKNFTIKEGDYGDYITFYIFIKYNYISKSNDIHQIVDRVYKFTDFDKLFVTDRDVHFYYIFTNNE